MAKAAFQPSYSSPLYPMVPENCQHRIALLNPKPEALYELRIMDTKGPLRLGMEVLLMVYYGL